MKNITLPTTFFTDMLALSPETQTLVLTTCQQLAAGDEDTIEQFQLPAGAPDLLADFVKRLKRRVRAARRRRQRAASQPKTVKKTEPATSTASADNSLPSGLEEPRNFAHAKKMFELAANYIIMTVCYADEGLVVTLVDTSNQVNDAINGRYYSMQSNNTRGYLSR